MVDTSLCKGIFCEIYCFNDVSVAKTVSSNIKVDDSLANLILNLEWKAIANTAIKMASKSMTITKTVINVIEIKG